MDTITELEKSVNTDIENLKIYVDTMDNHTLSMLTGLEEKHDADIKTLLHQIEAVNDKYNFLQEYIDKMLGLQKLEFSRLLSGLYHNTRVYIRTYFNKLSRDTITVISPLTAKRITLQQALEELLQWQATGLTAYEYRMLDLTATEYKNLNLTAEQYRLYGIEGEYIQPKNEHYSLEGELVEQPLSSVYSVFGHGLPANMDNLEITAETYRNISEEYNAVTLDRFGEYIFKGMYKSVNVDTVSISSDIITVNNGVTEKVLTLMPMLDYNEGVEYVSMFDTDSAGKAELMPQFDIDISSLDRPNGTFSAQIGSVTFDNATQALKMKCYIFNSLTDNGTPVPINVHFIGHTTTKRV